MLKRRFTNIKNIKEQAKKKRPPAKTPEAREKQLMMLAFDLAEKQILEGTASSQIITHFLKRGSSREQIEELSLIEDVSLKKAKTKAIQNQDHMEELLKSAMNAMTLYSGEGDNY